MMVGMDRTARLPAPEPATDAPPTDAPPPDAFAVGEVASGEWFRPPTRRERMIGGGLFVAFGLFFAALFIVQAGWWFRWVVLGLAGISWWCGIRHLLRARGAGSPNWGNQPTDGPSSSA